MKVSFSITEFSSRKVFTHHFHIHNKEGNFDISYGMIVDCEIVVKLGLKAEFGHQFLEWDCAAVPMKDPVNFIGKPNLTQCKMQEVVMQIEEPYSIIESTGIVVKILDSSYAKADLEEVATSAVQLDAN